MELDHIMNNTFKEHPRPCIKCTYFYPDYRSCRYDGDENYKMDIIQGKQRIFRVASEARHHETACGPTGRWFKSKRSWYGRKLISGSK